MRDLPAHADGWRRGAEQITDELGFFGGGIAAVDSAVEFCGKIVWGFIGIGEQFEGAFVADDLTMNFFRIHQVQALDNGGFRCAFARWVLIGVRATECVEEQGV